MEVVAAMAFLRFTLVAKAVSATFTLHARALIADLELDPAGGHHNPVRRGFQWPESAVVAAGEGCPSAFAVDPHLRALQRM